MDDDDITYKLGSLTASELDYITDTGSEYTINISTAPTTGGIASGNFAPTFTTLGDDAAGLTFSDSYSNNLDFKEIEEMCEEYPGLKNVYEKFKHVYDLVRQDWVGKQKDVI